MNPTINMILEIREKIAVFYRNYETIILFLLKFCAALFIFAKINSLGLYNEVFAENVDFMDGFPYLLLLAVLFAIAPPTLGNLIVLLAAIIQISASLEVALIAFLAGVCILVFYCRVDPKRSYLILAVLLGFCFKIPYAVVLFAGLYIGFAGIIPVTIGTAIWNFLPMFTLLAKSIETPSISEISDVSMLTGTFSDIYGAMQTQAGGDFQWVFSAFIFAISIVLIYAVSRLSFNYAKEMAVFLGGFICIFGNLLASTITEIDAGIGGVIFFVLLSVVLVLIVKFFDVALDYNKVEYVQFEDEDNFYYVKIVNKLKAEKNYSKTAAREEDEFA